MTEPFWFGWQIPARNSVTAGAGGARFDGVAIWRPGRA
jgi:hypothetical protein